MQSNTSSTPCQLRQSWELRRVEVASLDPYSHTCRRRFQAQNRSCRSLAEPRRIGVDILAVDHRADVYRCG
jgi:hypothetical protein